MKDLRLLLPAALIAAAILIPAGSSSADPPETLSCPDGFVLTPLGPAFPEKNKNGNLFVCVKEEHFNTVVKDDNCNPNCQQEPDPATIPEEVVVDDIVSS